jgi:O-antigen/teichoic acid export membrane protein
MELDQLQDQNICPSREVAALPCAPGAIQREWSRLEDAMLRVFRYVPGMRSTAASDRIRTAFRGSAWTVIGFGASQLLRLASTLVLARRLLGPEAFGLVALVNVFLSGLALLSDLGIGTDVIQHSRGDEPEFINTAFLIQAGRGILLWIIASALAYPFAHFYHRPEIRSLAFVASVSVLVQGLASGSVWKLTRHVRLERITLLRIGAEALGLVTSIIWAMLSPTAWALVVGRVTAEGFFSIGTHLIDGERVSMQWDPIAAKDILAFGTGMFFSSATYFLAGEAERLVVGKFVTLAVLGCFSLAISISTVATQVIQRILGQVFFPMISASVRTGRELAASQFKRVRLMLLMISGCMAVVFIAAGNWIVMVLLGPKYAMAGWMLQLLGFRAALDLFTSATTQMLFALGTSKYAALGNLAKLAFLVVGLTVAFSMFGIREAIWVLAISPIFAYIPLLRGIRVHLKTVFWSEVATFASLVVGAGMIALIYATVVKGLPIFS